MRLLVSCGDCKRRYKAAERKIGTKFRCHCGTVLTVAQPKSHAAANVKCSSCGGSREAEARSCSFCGSDFTLHERDLGTVCPSCFARVSDSARFCTECGDRLSGESIAGEESDLLCPVCPDKQKLASRRLGKEHINVLECQYCAGLWLATDSFDVLRDRVAKEGKPDEMLMQVKPQQLRKHVGPRYRNCVKCGEMMSRRQYGRGSGVIIDYCRNHGIWFDPEELHQTLKWIAEGGRSDTRFAKATSAQSKDDSVERIDEKEDRVNDHVGSAADFLDSVLTGFFQNQPGTGWFD